MTVKVWLHQTVDTMTDEEAQAALRTLPEASGDPVARTLDHAPLDDSPKPRTSFKRSPTRTPIANGKPVALGDVVAELDGA